MWIVDSGPVHSAGLSFPVRMTVLRLADGSLLLHSPTRYSPTLAAALALLGPIRHIVVPSIAHWMFARDWQRATPDATLWAAPGVDSRPTIRKSGLTVDRVLGDAAPPAWEPDVAMVPVRGGFGFVETVLFHRPTRTMVFTDLVQHFEPGKLPPLARTLLRALGGGTPAARPPVYLRALVRIGGGPAARAAAARLIDLAPERLVMTHGRIITADATARLRTSLAWLA